MAKDTKAIELDQALELETMLRRKMAEKLGHPPMIEVAGSVRRHKQVVNDLDVVVANAHGNILAARWAVEEICEEVLRRKYDGTITGAKWHGTRIELYVAEEDAFGAMLLYCTGSPEFNIWTRRIAKGKGFKLNQYGVFDLASEERVASASEDEILGVLGIEWIQPQAREKGPWDSYLISGQ